MVFGKLVHGALVTALSLSFAVTAQAEDWSKRAAERDIVLKDFHFADGEMLPQVRMHVTTLGAPHRNTSGQIDNAVMVLHGTGGDGHQFYSPQFADALYGPGQPLDISTHYVILPDNIGHGKSSKPSDGMRMAFPKYDYADMVAAQHRMLTEGLGVASLQLVLGTSMGCMHAFVWGETYPGFARRLAPFACNAVELGGRNRMWRKMLITAIEADPLWDHGNYATPPVQGLRTARYLGAIAGANPLAMQDKAPTRAQADALVEASEQRAAKTGEPDANDQIYQFDASRTYNPAPYLEKITVPVLWINSADDFINPPELGLAQTLVERMPRAKFVLIPASSDTHGHGTHTWAKFWTADLVKLLATDAN